MLDWWQWVLFPDSLIAEYGVSPALRKYYVGLSQRYTYRFACTLGFWGWSSHKTIQSVFGGKKARSADDLELDFGICASWEAAAKRLRANKLQGIPEAPTFPHLALMGVIYQNELLRMRQDSLSVPLAAGIYDARSAKKTRYGVTPVEVVRYFQTQVQILREYRITFSAWRSWNEEQQQTAWVHGGYSLRLPEAAHKWARAHARKSRAPNAAARFDRFDPARTEIPPAEIPLADLRGTLPVTRRYAKAPRSLHR